MDYSSEQDYKEQGVRAQSISCGMEISPEPEGREGRMMRMEINLEELREIEGVNTSWHWQRLYIPNLCQQINHLY